MLLSICTVFLVFSSCSLNAAAHASLQGNYSTSSRIFGGQVAPPHSAPFMVSLRNIYSPLPHNCGATLISANFILTAAHCVDTPGAAYEAILGSHSVFMKEPGEESRIVTPIIHEYYTKIPGTKPNSVIVMDHDIALGRLDRPVRSSSTISPVKLPSLHDITTYLNMPGKVYGWGDTGTPEGPSVLLRVASVTVGECDIFEPEYQYKICTSHSQIGVCHGDSGGPLLVNGVQVGVTSKGSGHCSEMKSPIFTFVNKYLDWIQKNSDITMA